VDQVATEVRALLAQLEPIGRSVESGGYRRSAWTPEDDACRLWFEEQARRRGLLAEPDRNGNLWAWWPSPPTPGQRAVATGSHLDSVPDGGPLDGPLGVVSAFAAIDYLRELQVEPSKPIAIVDWADEEGARFGLACVGSRLSTGVLDPERARLLTDGDGLTLARVLEGAGMDPAGIGRDAELLGRLDAFVELHVEQGRALADLGAPVALATAIWPHGRWRIRLSGEANHAGTTRLADRHDPVLALAAAAVAARSAAEQAGALATLGRVELLPNATNAVASQASGWLDARARDDATLDSLVASVKEATEASAEEHGVTATFDEESRTPAVVFDEALRARLDQALGGVPAIPTGAGHDAGILAAVLPTAMLFVRNPTGVSHNPAEHADLEDMVAGVLALATVLRTLVS
jgi:beta-ureidopropionase / N-carbamoyl-L-amino-acid hydrolase